MAKRLLVGSLRMLVSEVAMIHTPRILLQKKVSRERTTIHLLRSVFTRTDHSQPSHCSSHHHIDSGWLMMDAYMHSSGLPLLELVVVAAWEMSSTEDRLSSCRKS